MAAPESINNALVVAEAPKPAILVPIAKPAEALAAHKAAVEFINTVLEVGRDIGKIPGTDDKLNLLKPGAERLCGGYGLRPEYEVIEQEVDHDRETQYRLSKWVKKEKPSNWQQLKDAGLGRNKKFGNSWAWQEKEEEIGTAQGLYRYVIRCRLFLPDGREAGQGVGSCSSLETKYVRSPRDSENTILKMAKKRAFVDGTLTTLGLSDRFTQDIEDIRANQAVVDDSLVAEAEDVRGASPAASPENPRGQAFAILKELNLPEHDGTHKSMYYQVFGKLLRRDLDTLRWITDTEWMTIVNWLIGVREGTMKMPAAFQAYFDSHMSPPEDGASTAETVLEAELVEEGNGASTAPGSTPCAPSPAAPAPAASNPPSTESAQASKVEQPEGDYDPFEDDDTPVDMPANPQESFYELCEELNMPSYAQSPQACAVVYRTVLGREINDMKYVTADDFAKLYRFAAAVKRDPRGMPTAFKIWQKEQAKGGAQ